MGDGVGRHEELETEKTREEVILDVTGPHAGVAAGHKSPADMVDDGIEEGAGAASGVQDQDFVTLDSLAGVFFPFNLEAGIVVGNGDFGGVGKAIGAVEAGLEQVIDRTDDVADDRFGGVVDAAGFTKLRIVGGKEGLVEMDDWVLLAGAATELGQDGFHIGIGEQVNKIVYEWCEGFIIELGT
jgi:hypothetical protein